MTNFVFERRERGSHEFWVNYDTKLTMVSKHSTKTIPKGTLNNIIKAAGISVDDFAKL